jgi:2-polyprenyl-6-methoxyphenol hydroxylase-like FAD-dependent oxidoreductase
VRRLVFGEDALFQHYLGYSFASYQLADRYGVGHAWKNYVEPGRWVSAYCGNKDGEIVALLIYKTADEGYIPHEQRLPRLRKAFAQMGWITQRLLENAPDPAGIFLDTMTQIQMPCWHQGRVALVGDACGCPTSLSGQGASMAMGGAYMLAEALHTMPDYASAFHYYEQQVRPHVEQRQKNARGLARTSLPESSIGLVMQQFMMKLLLRDTFRGLLRQQFGAESFLPLQSSGPGWRSDASTQVM